MIHVVQEATTDALFDRLAEDLAASPPGPAIRETVVVDSLGMARRLPQELALRLGALANLETPFPARFIWERWLRPVAEEDGESPWDRQALAWRLAEHLPHALAEPGAGMVARLLERDDDARLRLELAHRLAAIFDQYLVYRPRWLLEWEGAEDARLLPGGPPPDTPVANWQALLWRLLRRSVPTPHRAGLQAAWIRSLEQGIPPSGPGRLSLFALGGLPPAHLQVFAQAARCLPVRLYLLNPSREYWGDLVRRRPRAAIQAAGGQAPLLAACGSQLGSWIDSLLDCGAQFEDPLRAPPAGDSALRRLQRALFDLEPLDDIEPDVSLQFHSCHSMRRQAETLLDALHEAFQSDPGLNPADILVLCPDLDSARPALEAVFSAAEPDGALPWRILGGRPAGNLASWLEGLLDLPGSRWELSAVMDLLRPPAVRRRLGLEPEDPQLLMELLEDAGVRWGWDATARDGLGLPATGANSWQAGLDRILLGYAQGTAVLVEGLLPLATAELDPARLQACWEAVAALRGFCREAELERTPPQWADWLLDWLPRLVEGDSGHDDEAGFLRTALLDWRAGALAAGALSPLSFPAARDELRRALSREEGIRGGGFDGRLVIAPMLACRAVPAKLVAVLGLDGGVFPRPTLRDGLDLALAQPLPGDRNPRQQDRAAFLEALVCARDRLLLFWSGRDERENRERPPSPVVSELLDMLGGAEAWVQGHPLQAFSPANFLPPARPRGRQPVWGRAAEALLRARREPACLVADTALVDPLPLAAPATPTVDALARFAQNPARAFLRHAGVRLPYEDREPEQEEPFPGDPLERSRLRASLLAWESRGVPPATQQALLRAEGRLPWGAIGQGEFRALRGEIQDLLERARESGWEAEPELRETIVEVGDGRRLAVRIPRADGPRLELRPGSLANMDPVPAWVRHLAWCAAGGGASLLLALDGSLELPALPPDHGLLRDWLDAWEAGHRAWLPWLPVASLAAAREIAAATRDSRPPRLELDLYPSQSHAWEDASLRRVLGGADPFRHPVITPRLVEWARRLGGPLVEALA